MAFSATSASDGAWKVPVGFGPLRESHVYASHLGGPRGRSGTRSLIGLWWRTSEEPLR